jgi:hypothetical protein
VAAAKKSKGTPEDQLWGAAKRVPKSAGKPPGKNTPPSRLGAAAASGMAGGKGKARVTTTRGPVAKAVNRAASAVQGKPGAKGRNASRKGTR